MSQAETWTIGRLLSWTTEYFQRQGFSTPRLDAEVLLAHALGCERIRLYTQFDVVADEGPRAAFREMVKRRAAGTPVAYLVGSREFFSLRFHVTPAVLIPRPETEFLVIALLDLAKEASPGTGGAFEICDVGTGSGIIAICAARHLPHASVVAVDICREALEVARRNAVEHDVADRVEFREGDLLAAVPLDRRFDFIVSNPPYVSESELERLESTVREYEPHQALVAGPRGTEVIERLVAQSAERLKPGGHLLFEISPMIRDAACEVVEQAPNLELVRVIDDLSGLPRVVHARLA